MLTFSEALGLFLLLASFIIGIGTVSVVCVNGFHACRSGNWTSVTAHTHNITKPLIWIGIILFVIGGRIFYAGTPFIGVPFFHFILIIILILNGCFLGLVVCPCLLKHESENRGKKLLPKNMQVQVLLNFIISFLGWSISLALLVCYLVSG